MLAGLGGVVTGWRLLFLDVDGPLLPFGGVPESYASGSTLDRLDPRLGVRLAALPAELVWATSWEDDANLRIAPRLGLPALPVVHWPEPAPGDEQEQLDRWYGLHWKLRPLVRWADGRPFAWVDDEIAETDREWVREHGPGPALLHRVPADRGLQDEDFAVLESWFRAR